MDNHPEITFRSLAVRPAGDHFLVDGDLTIRGVTRPTTLELEVNGFTPDPYGGTRAGFTATTEINRQDFEVQLQRPHSGCRQRHGAQ